MEDRGQHQEEGEDETAGSGDEGNAEVPADQGEVSYDMQGRYD